MATPLPYVCNILRQQNKTVDFLDQQSTSSDIVTQTAPKGSTLSVNKFTLKWVGLSISEKETLRSILDSIGTWGLVSYQPFGESSSMNLRAVSSYSLQLEQNLFTISCEFKQVTV